MWEGTQNGEVESRCVEWTVGAGELVCYQMGCSHLGLVERKMATHMWQTTHQQSNTCTISIENDTTTRSYGQIAQSKE